MKRILFLGTLAFASIARAQSGAESDNDPRDPRIQQKPPEVQGTTLPDYIASIAEQDEISAQDYHNMAQGTMDVAMAVLQSGEKMPEPPLRDALDAVAAGRELDPTIPDWDDIEQRLLDLLNPPPQQQQQNQDQQQEGDSSDSQETQEGQDGEPQKSGEGEQSDSENQEGGEQQDQPQEGQSEDGEQNQDGSQEQQSGEEGGDEEAANSQQTQDGAQMGELGEDQEEQNVQLDESAGDQESSPEDMQSVGGQQSTGEPVNAETAALKQMLEKLKQQDEPGKLYQILQEAQSGGQKKQQPNAKDW